MYAWNYVHDQIQHDRRYIHEYRQTELQPRETKTNTNEQYVPVVVSSRLIRPNNQALHPHDAPVYDQYNPHINTTYYSKTTL